MGFKPMKRDCSWTAQSELQSYWEHVRYKHLSLWKEDYMINHYEINHVNLGWNSLLWISVTVHMHDLFHNCTIMKSNLCAIEFQSSATINQKQDLSVLPEQSGQTIRTNQDSGLDSWFVSPYRAVKSDHQDQPGQWICQSMQSSQVRPTGPTRTVDLSAHAEQSSQTIRTNQDSGSVSPYRAFKSDHQD